MTVDDIQQFFVSKGWKWIRTTDNEQLLIACEPGGEPEHNTIALACSDVDAFIIKVLRTTRQSVMDKLKTKGLIDLMIALDDCVEDEDGHWYQPMEQLYGPYDLKKFVVDDSQKLLYDGQAIWQAYDTSQTN